MSDLEWKPDILGAGYAQCVLELGADPDGEGAVEAVLVRREPRPDDAERGVVLYVHGFSDYFFQTELADFFAARGLRFYALDLRKCGRARRPGQTAHYVSDLAYYDAELDRALEIVTTAHPGLPVIMVAHSTGGLVVPLWLDRNRDRRRRGGGGGGAVTGGADGGPVTGGGGGPVPGGGGGAVTAVVLNSPWLDLQGSALLRGPVTQLLRVLARVRPFQSFRPGSGVYGRSLHVSGTGEWDFDTELKPLDAFPVTFGWLNAIRRGHARVHQGIETGVPTLVLRSSRSDFSKVYSALSDRADVVLDTRQIGYWAGRLGSQVTDVPIGNARHDVFLSLPESRERAYAALDAWLTRVRG